VREESHFRPRDFPDPELSLGEHDGSRWPVGPQKTRKSPAELYPSGLDLKGEVLRVPQELVEVEEQGRFAALPRPLEEEVFLSPLPIFPTFLLFFLDNTP